MKNTSIHVLLLPVFFITNKYIQYQGMPGSTIALSSFLQVLVISLITSFLYFLVVKNKRKACLLSTFSLFIILYFGNIRVFMQQQGHDFFLSQYKFFLPLLALLFFLFVRMIREDQLQIRTNLFLNFLLLVVLCIDTANIIQMQSVLKEKSSSTQAVFTNSLNKKPDIYYIVADCYPSSQFQKEVLGINNQYFEDSLNNEGFFIPSVSKSNYNRTAFSMLSTFEMDYLQIFDTSKRATPKTYAIALRDIKSAMLFRYLEENGYNLINLSIFDIAKTKAVRKQSFLAASPKEMFFSHTMWNYFIRDIYYTWIINKNDFRNELNKKMNRPLKKYNRQLEDTMLRTNFSNLISPVFVYTHFNMPHFPYFFNENGIAYSEDSIYGKEMITNRTRFASYIKYSNKKLLGIIKSIKEKSDGKAVIILQSDHGISDLTPGQKDNSFRNFTALYFPDKNYANLSNKMSNVNTFRFVLNKYMTDKMPILPDSTVYIKF